MYLAQIEQLQGILDYINTNGWQSLAIAIGLYAIVMLINASFSDHSRIGKHSDTALEELRESRDDFKSLLAEKNEADIKLANLRVDYSELKAQFEQVLDKQSQAVERFLDETDDFVTNLAGAESLNRRQEQLIFSLETQLKEAQRAKEEVDRNLALKLERISELELLCDAQAQQLAAAERKGKK